MEIDPENAWACYNLGNVLMRQGRPEEAVAAFERSLKLDPDLATASNDLANVLRNSGDSMRPWPATAARSRSIRIMPRRTTIWAWSWTARDDRAEAAEHFRKALEINPEYVQAHNNLGVLLMNQGMLADAIVQFRAAIALDPKFDLPHGNLGACRAIKARTPPPRPSCGPSCGFQPDQPQVLGWLAWILATAPEDAVRSGKEAVGLAEKAANSRRIATLRS